VALIRTKNMKLKCQKCGTEFDPDRFDCPKCGESQDIKPVYAFKLPETKK